jgi:phosphopantothenoylcysteine decarboxylase/phosphopantothenate--cysteine ligase
MVIAPLSCNTLAKMANGLCDNLLLAVYLSATCPVVVAPAMDEDMWMHPATKNNLRKLRSFNNIAIPVNAGELASGLSGEGRMAEPEEIINYLKLHFEVSSSLKDKKVLVTAGPTYEPLDPVRFIGNHSSGKMGVALAKELRNKGAAVHLILGPTRDHFDLQGMQVTRVKTASEMFDACSKHFSTTDLLIMAAAVADYTPIEMAETKIKKKEENLQVALIKTEDILKTLVNKKSNGQVIVGFALETDNEIENAKNKLKHKNADMIVLNSLNDEGAGFGTDTNRITIFDKSGKEWRFNTNPKHEVANDIINTIMEMYYA